MPGIHLLSIFTQDFSQMINNNTNSIIPHLLIALLLPDVFAEAVFSNNTTMPLFIYMLYLI